MADALVRLRVESQEYDNKLKRATEQLQHMEEECRKIGGTFEYVDKEQLDLVKSLGQMETKATSAKGKVAEMTKSYTELSLQYKRLSDQEKQSPFGKAMAQSLDQLKSRIKDANIEIKEVSQELGGGSNGLGGIMDAVAGKIGIPVEMFTKLGAAAAGVGAAIKVATDALKQNEEFMDEWGRITESATAIYDGFLNALNTGNFSGFFRSMDDIVLAARAAYDAMDELGTFNAFNQIQKEAAKTNFTQSVADFREGKVSREDAQAAAEALKKELEAQADKEREAYEAAVAKLAATRGVNAEMLLKALSGDYGSYQDLKALPLSNVTEEWNGSWSGTNNMSKVYSPANEQEALGHMLRTLSDDELNAIQALGAQAQRTATEVAQIDRQMVRLLGTSKKTGAIVKPEEVLPAGSIAEIEKRISDLNNKLKMAGDQTTRDNIRLQIQALKDELGMMNEDLTRIDTNVIPLEVELAPTAAEVLANEMNELRKRLGMDPIQLDITTGKGGVVDTAKETEKAWGAAASAISAIGGALQSIEDPSAKVAGIVAQAIANIALTFSASLKGTFTPWDWIAAALSGTATMISTISAIKSVTQGFSEGGEVKGNSYSGDNIVARLNAGEGVLTQRGISTAAEMARGNGMGALRLSTEVSGTNLRIVLDNDNRKRGGSRGWYANTH